MDCDNGVFCDGRELCVSAAGTFTCVRETAPRCQADQSCDEAADRCVTDCASGGDADSDGALAEECGGADCDDSQANVYPLAVEICDDVDNDCDATTLGTTDVDDDGYISSVCCNPVNPGTAGPLGCGNDCDDSDAAASIDDPEVCNGTDDDCDGVVDEGLRIPLYPDGDGDMFGAEGGTETMLCPGTPGYSPVASDCRDDDNSIFPGAAESCDGEDENCNDMTDEGAGITYYRDGDGDDFGDLSMPMIACSLPDGHALNGDDCDDAHSTANPAATEICDDLDNDCNDMEDENLGAPCSSGLGICARPGNRRCDGSCTGVAAASGGLSSTRGANDSWDHDCDGAVTPEFAYTRILVGVAYPFDDYCVMFDGSPLNMAACENAPGFIHAPSGAASPYCGETVYQLPCQVHYDPFGVAYCAAKTTPPAAGVNRCR